MPLTTAAALAGAQILGSAANSISQGNMNRKNRAFSREMYNQQYSDNIDFWNMQNSYNDPQQQMQRLQNAGLNPNLVYGQNSGAASGQASPINTPDVQNTQYRSPEWGNGLSTAGLTYMNAMYDFDIKQAQLDNLKKDGDTKIEEAALKRAQQLNLTANTNTTDFNLDFEKEMRKFSSDFRREQTRKAGADAQFSLDNNERAAQLHKATLLEKAEAVLLTRERRANTQAERANIRAKLTGLKADSRIKELDKQLREMRINPNDPIWARALGHLLNEFQKPKG